MTETAKGTGASGAVLHIDLGREMHDFGQHRPWQSGIYSKTLVKKKDFRIVLISMDRDCSMDEHHTDGTVSIHALAGAIEVSAGDEKFALNPGHLLMLEPSVKHSVRAQDASSFLVTFSWPSSEELRGMTHRGYGS